MSAKLPLSNPLLLGAVPGMVQDPKVLNMLASVPASRPLDQNGIDVYGEIPVMQRAYMHAQGIAHRIRGAESGYAIFSSPPGVGHTGFVEGSENAARIPVPPNTLAIVHTHPPEGLPTPGPKDANMNYPNYIYSRNRLFVTVPHTKQYYEYDINKWGNNR